MVADATRLERNMNLILQVLQITDKAVLCVNLLDEAKRNKRLNEPKKPLSKLRLQQSKTHKNSTVLKMAMKSL